MALRRTAASEAGSWRSGHPPSDTRGQNRRASDLLSQNHTQRALREGDVDRELLGDPVALVLDAGHTPAEGMPGKRTERDVGRVPDREAGRLALVHHLDCRPCGPGIGDLEDRHPRVHDPACLEVAADHVPLEHLIGSPSR